MLFKSLERWQGSRQEDCKPRSSRRDEKVKLGLISPCSPGSHDYTKELFTLDYVFLTWGFFNGHPLKLYTQYYMCTTDLFFFFGGFHDSTDFQIGE